MHTAQKFKVNAITAAMLATMAASSFAQEESNNQQEEKPNEPVEVIEVTGIKGSLSKSLNDKRLSSQIKDTINAEDIGKNTDQNIADALGRVTGVSIVNRDGEGAQVTVRGAGANQNIITLNGQQLSSTDFSQSVDLSSFSADILSRLEVVKTPSADQDEGSLGATINLVTVKPLNQKDDIRAITLQGRYNDFSDEYDRKINFTVSEKFLDDTLGVALTAYDETNTVRRDQYRVGNFQETNVLDTVTDQNGNVLSGVRGIRHTNTNYQLLRSTNDRQGFTVGVQWLAGDVTEVNFDLTHSNQTQERRNDAISTRYPGTANFVEGVAPLTVRPAATFTDPQQDWYQINTDTLTMTRFINRFGAGDLTSSVGGDEKDNTNGQIRIEHELSERLRLNASFGFSKSESESLPSAFAALQNFRNLPAQLLYDAGRDVQPVGYECDGDFCQLVHGSGFVDLGEQIVDETIDGVFTAGNLDNTAITSFNPADQEALHLVFLQENRTEVSDEILTAKVDFDYDLDEFGITTIEFGAKATQREKRVDDQAFQFSTVTATEVFEDANGNPIAVQGGSLLDVRSSFIAQDGGLPYADFLESLGYPRNAATTAWSPVDAVAAVDLLLDDENTLRTPDDSESRNLDIDTQSIYVKANFEFLDGQLTGDIGLRYVKTDVDATGFGGADFHQFTETLEREFDLVRLRDLRNTSLPECRQQVFANPGEPLGYERKYQRSDGFGWDTSSGPDPSTWVRIPDQGACHDPSYAQWVSDQIANGESDININWLTMWQYADVLTTRGGNWDPSNTSAPYTYDGTTPIQALNTTQFVVDGAVNRELQSFATEGSHSYANLLPSLNVNYIYSDDIIARFAVSQTMTRPEIDNLRPGFQLQENGYWGSGLANAGSRLSLFNTKLEPLTSNNLDISLEWYFAPTSLLSVALFYKDMSDFETTESVISYLADVRDVNGPLTQEELLLTETDDAANDFGLNGCMPLRATADFGWQASDPNRFSDDLRDLCAQYTVTKVVNGDGAKIQGIELGYVQAFDFLDGYFWGGTGISANYTYQDSEYKTQASTLDSTQTIATLPVADTPEHTYNVTTFWERDGHQVRLSYRGTSDSLVGIDYNTGFSGRTWNQGSLFNEGRGSLDLSASYKVNKDVVVTLQAINLLDDPFRQYFTSRTLEVQRVFAENDVGYEFVALDEGNPLDGGVTKSRTYTNYKVGTTYRLGVRVTF